MDAPESVQPGSSDLASNASSWTSLPVKVRQMILELSSGTPTLESQSNDLGLMPPKMAGFASVNREWQAFFEPRIFRCLVLDTASLNTFETIIKRHNFRLGYIRKVWLHIQLSTYGCPECDTPEDGTTQARNNSIFTTCVQSLLETLSLWDSERHGAAGLNLTLSTSSPSDTEHRFSACDIKAGRSFHYTEDLDVLPVMHNFHQANVSDPVRLSVHDGRPPPVDGGHLKRIRGSPLHLQLHTRRDDRGRFISSVESLPAVPIVKGLYLRRHVRRKIHLQALSLLLIRSFFGLERFHIERTGSLKSHQQTAVDRDSLGHPLPSLPKTLRSLSLTQWDSPDTELVNDVDPESALHRQAPEVSLHREMTRLSQRLHELCPPWQMDSVAYLHSIIASGNHQIPSNSSLQRLVLRCQLVDPDRSRRDFESVVILAAQAAECLPQLQVMEIWGFLLRGRQSRAYTFRYTSKGLQASDVRRSFEETSAIPENIAQAWKQVTSKNLESPLTTTTAVRGAEASKSPESYTYRSLVLGDLMLDPAIRNIMETTPDELALNDENGSMEHGGLLDQIGVDPGVLMDILRMYRLHIDLVSPQEESMAFRAEVDVFHQSWS